MLQTNGKTLDNIGKHWRMAGLNSVYAVFSPRRIAAGSS